jgi:SAM domain (Sterile alpha motif)
MQQVADWLETLGLSEYAQRFAENRIDFSVLPELTDQDLEKIGVVLGDRRKIYVQSESLGAPPPPPTPLLLRRRSHKTPPSAAK